MVYYNIIKEEGWEIVKKYKNPTIDYNKLQYYTFEVVKNKNQSSLERIEDIGLCLMYGFF